MLRVPPKISVKGFYEGLGFRALGFQGLGFRVFFCQGTTVSGCSGWYKL